MNEIKYYLERILQPALVSYGASMEFIAYTLEKIEIQLNSILRHWNDTAFRKTVLLIGAEEGSFYQPSANNDIRCFVVTTIRNSPFETFQSDAYSETGIKTPLESEGIKVITGEAINYFSKQDFSKLCMEMQGVQTFDLYDDIRLKYPVAWKALQQLALLKSKETNYERVERERYYPQGIESSISLQEMESKCEEDIENGRMITPTIDGYDMRIDPDLHQYLMQIAAGKIDFFVGDSFKSISRNIEKLFQVIECVLTHDKKIVLTNFYLENGHVEKRKSLLKAGHSTQEMTKNMAQLAGLGSRHREILSKIRMY